MAATIETETKLELNESECRLLITTGRIETVVDQLNIYYDDQWKLANRACTFRIRVCPRKVPLITFKTSLSYQNGKRVAREVEIGLESIKYPSVTRKQFDVQSEFPRELRDDVLELGVESLSRVGWVRNRRHVINFSGLGSIEVDHLRLPHGQSFFEAEIESENPAIHHELVRYIRSLVPAARPSALSKFERFRRAVVAEAGAF